MSRYESSYDRDRDRDRGDRDRGRDWDRDRERDRDRDGGSRRASGSSAYHSRDYSSSSRSDYHHSQQYQQQQLQQQQQRHYHHHQQQHSSRNWSGSSDGHPRRSDSRQRRHRRGDDHSRSPHRGGTHSRYAGYGSGGRGSGSGSGSGSSRGSYSSSGSGSYSSRGSHNRWRSQLQQQHHQAPPPPPPSQQYQRRRRRASDSDYDSGYEGGSGYDDGRGAARRSPSEEGRPRRRRSPTRSPSEGSDRSSDLSGDDSSNDDVGKVDIRPGERLKNGRYKVIGLAGQGTFGTVLDVLDTKHNERVALKVVRSVKRYLEAANDEIEILDKLREADKDRNSLCVRLYSTFSVWHRGQKHVCLGFEKLGCSLYDFLKHNDFRAFQVEDVRAFGFQLLHAVGFCHSIGLIHTDLKLENVLLVNDESISYPEDQMRFMRASHSGSDSDSDSPREPSPYRVPRYNAIRLIDFGGATFERDRHSRIINTRQYRGPEVLLGLGWSYPSDIWGVGCILGELMSGELLFSTHSYLEHLALFERKLERPIPLSMVRPALGSDYAPDGDPEDARQRDSGSSERSAKRRRYKESGSGSGSRSQYAAAGTRGQATPEDSRSPSAIAAARRDRSSIPRAANVFHRRTGALRWPECAMDSASVRHVERAVPIAEQFAEWPDFVELLRRVLEYEPELRVTAEQASQMEFFRTAKIRQPPRRGSGGSGGGDQ